MQVHVVDHTNFFHYAAELDQFFRARHRVYAEELKWVPPAPNGREVDRFDTVDATYLLVIERGQVIGGSRMVPTHLPHLVAEVFPNAFTLGPIVRRPDVVEWTRGFILPEHREGAGLEIKARCCAAVMEFCLANGFRQVGGIQEVKWLAIWKRMGWSVHKHGEPIDIGGDAWLPAYFDVTEAALESARQWGRVSGPLLIDNRLSRAA